MHPIRVAYLIFLVLAVVSVPMPAWSWIQVGADIDGESDLDSSGSAVALSTDGTRVAIGAKYNDGGGNDAGHVRVYDWNGTAWVQVGTDIDGESPGELSGTAVALAMGDDLAHLVLTGDGDVATGECASDRWLRYGHACGWIMAHIPGVGSGDRDRRPRVLRCAGRSARCS